MWGCSGDNRGRGIDLCDFADRDVYDICWTYAGDRRMAVVVVYWRLLGRSKMTAIESALDRIEDCGLDDYEQESAKEYLQEGIRRLDMAYDIVDFAED